MTIVTRLTSSPSRGPFAEPRPDMVGRYLIRNRAVVRAFRAMDAALSLVPVRARAAPASPKRLLLANWAHLGDVTTTLGAVRLLRERFPDAHLGMIVGSWGLAAARSWGLIDAFHVVDHWSLNRSAATAREKRAHYRRTRRDALRAIAATRYEAAIDFYPFFPPAHPLFWRAGIPVRIGFDSGGWGPLLTHRVRWPDRDMPIAEHYGALIEAAWPAAPIAPGALRPRMEPARLLPSLPGGPAAGAPYVVLHPGTGADSRDWGAEHWIALIARLRDDPDPACRRILITGAGAKDAALAARLTAAVAQGDAAGGTVGNGAGVAPDGGPGGRRTEVIDMTGRLDWDGFLAVLAQARLIVCPDTVTSHLGAMFDTPLVCIFTGIVKPAQWGPYSDAARLLVQAVACAPCNRWGCEAMACIRQTTADDVMHAIRAQLRPAG